MEKNRIDDGTPTAQPSYHALELVMIIGFGAVSSVDGAVIDLFAHGAQEVERTMLDSPSSTTSPPTALDGGLFWERTLQVSFGLSSLVVDTLTNRARFRFGGPTDSSLNSRGYFSLIYRSPDPVDLDAVGITSLVVRFTGTGFISPNDLNFGIEIKDRISRETVRRLGSQQTFDPETGIHTVEVNLEKWGRVNTSKVTELNVQTARIGRPVEVEVLSITAVPEPSAVALAIMGVSVGVLRRRRIYRFIDTCV